MVTFVVNTRNHQRIGLQFNAAYALLSVLHYNTIVHSASCPQSFHLCDYCIYCRNDAHENGITLFDLDNQLNIYNWYV